MSYGHECSIKIDHHINNVTYPIELPEYAVMKHDVFSSGELQPFSIPDRNTNILTRATIANMIDYCDRVIKFKILNSYDIVEIDMYLEDYITQLNAYAELEEAAAYLAKARYFKDQLAKSINILSKTDEKLLKKLRADNLLNMFKGGLGDSSS